MRLTPTRRRLLAGALGAGTAGVAGCLDVDRGGGGSKLELIGHPFTTDSPAEEFIFEVEDFFKTSFIPDYSSSYKRSVIESIVTQETASVIDWKPVFEHDFGPEKWERPTFVEHDGSYHRLHLEGSSTVEREWWEFYLDYVEEEPPSSADVVSPPFDDFSPVDRRVMDGAIASTTEVRSDDIVDTGDLDPGERGVIYHPDLDEEASDLVPNPPMDYVSKEGNHFVPKAERTTLEYERSTFSSELVGESWSEYAAYAREELPAVRFSEISLSNEETDVLDEATKPEIGFRYTEDSPLSDGLEGVLEPLGIAEHLQPVDEYEQKVEFLYAIAEYQGEWHQFEFQLTP